MRRHLAMAMIVGLSGAYFGEASADVWKWKGDDGKWFFADRPPLEKDSEKVRLSGTGFTEDNMSPETKEAARLFPVTLYANDCGEPCAGAAKLLSSMGVPHAKKNPMESKESLAEFRKKWPQSVVPALAIGDKVLSGFEPAGWKAALEAVGYGKAAKKDANPAPKETETGSPAAK